MRLPERQCRGSEKGSEFIRIRKLFLMSAKMTLRVECDSCGRSLRLKGELAGRRAKCPCGKVFRVPTGKASADVPVAKPYVAKPTVLDGEEAEAIVREAAARHKAKPFLKQLGNLSPSVVRNAQDHFADTMEDDETPLVLLEDSFLQNVNGKSGMLVTNRRLYSDQLKRPIPLVDVVVVLVETPTQLEFFLAGMFGLVFVLFRGRLKNRLLVNGCLVHEGRLGHHEFWKDVLAELGRATRAEAPDAPPPRRDKPKELVRLAAAAVCSGRDRDRILDDLESLGHPAEACLPLVDELLERYETPRRGPMPIALVVVGAMLACVGIAVTLESRGSFLWYGPVMFGMFGVGLVCIGGWRLIAGSPPMTAAELRGTYEDSTP